MSHFINKSPEAYSPFRPQHPHILSHISRTVQPVDRDGLFYLKDERSDPMMSTITGYQEWCEQGWKKQHGTYEAATRFTDKLMEEVGEMQQALINFRKSGDRKSDAARELISELGDVIWCAIATASNSSADVDMGLKSSLAEYAHGVIDYSAGQARPTSWRRTAAEVSYMFTDIAFEDLDTLLKAGFEPLPSPAMNIYDEEPQLGVAGHAELILMHSLALRTAVEQQYAYGELDQTMVLSVSYDKQSAHVAIAVAEILLNSAYIAQQELGVDLGELLEKNRKKVNNRIQAGRVDKADGEREQGLL